MHQHSARRASRRSPVEGCSAAGELHCRAMSVQLLAGARAPQRVPVGQPKLLQGHLLLRGQDRKQQRQQSWSGNCGAGQLQRGKAMELHTHRVLQARLLLVRICSWPEIVCRAYGCYSALHVKIFDAPHGGRFYAFRSPAHKQIHRFDGLLIAMHCTAGCRAPRRRSADACLGSSDAVHAQGRVISLTDSESDTDRAGDRQPGTGSPPACHSADSVQCFSDPGVLRRAPAGGVSGAASRDTSSSDDDVASAGSGAASASKARRRASVVAALLGRLEASPEHMYWDQESEPDEAEIARDEDLEDTGEHRARAGQCVFLDEAAGSGGHSDDNISGSKEQHARPRKRPAPDAAIALHPRSGQQRRPRSRRSKERDLFAGLSPLPAPARGLATVARLTDDVHICAGSDDSPESSGGGAGHDIDFIDSDGDGDGHHVPAARRALSDSLNGGGSPHELGATAAGDDVMAAGAEGHDVDVAEWAGEEQEEEERYAAARARAHTPAAERRRARRQREEAEMQQADPEGYRRMLATREALAPYGWDKCAVHGVSDTRT
jgi:hypothetical protein